MTKLIIVNLFAKWQARYLSKWSGQFKNDQGKFDQELLNLAITEWQDVLGGLSEDEIKYGLARWREPWPPTPPFEFRRVCRPLHSLAHQENDRLLALPILKAQNKTRDAEMAKIRQMKNIRVGC